MCVCMYVCMYVCVAASTASSPPVPVVSDASSSDYSNLLAQMDVMGQNLRKDISGEMAAMVDAKMGAHHMQFAGIVKQSMEINLKKFGHIESSISAQNSRLDGVEDTQRKMAEQLEALSLQMATVEKTEYTQKDLREEGWAREADACIVVAGTASMVTKEALTAAIASHVAACQFPEGAFAVRGNGGLGKKWVLEFAGDKPTQGLARERAKKFMQLLKRDDGSYHEISVAAPASGPVRIYYNKDESLQQAFISRCGKKFRQIIAERLPDKQAHFEKSTGIVSVDWIPIAHIAAPRPREPQVKWHKRVEENFRLTAEDRKVVKDRWSALIGAASAEKFCL